MFMEKLTNAGVAFALLGLGMLVGCSDDSSSIASTLSETNTGKPIALLDTADFEKQFSDGKNSCAEEVLAKEASEDIATNEEYQFDTVYALLQLFSMVEDRIILAVNNHRHIHFFLLIHIV